jgi:MYXO-CTERM domain-containing protein
MNVTRGWLSIAVIAGTAGAAHATEHMMVVNEVLRSSGGDAGAQLIELWDTGDEPFPAPTYAVEIYDAAGAVVGRVDAPGISGGGGPTYYVLATTAAEAALGITADAPLTTALPIDGQACFLGTNDRKVHCIAWGCVDTRVTPATPLGASPPDGASLQRTPDGAILTVAGPTPGAANATGTMDEPCPTGPMPDAAGGDGDDSGSCGCRGTGSPANALPIAFVALITLRRRRAS